jgi:hypothetical protein
MNRTTLSALAMAGLIGCSHSGESKSLAADSLSRDLSRPAAAATEALNDGAAPAPQPQAAAPKPRPKPAPRPPPAVAPDRVLEPGTEMAAEMVDSVDSRHTKQGETVIARIARDVKDRSGRVVVPAGSTVSLTVMELEPAKGKGAKDGKLAFRVNSVDVQGRVYALDADVGPVAHDLRGRGVTAGEVEKVGAGTAIGAIGGRVIGGNTKGAVIGGLIGAAGGTAVAVATASRDVVVHAGTPVTLTLRGKLVASRR